MAVRSHFFSGKRVPRWLAGTTAAAIVLLGMPALSLAPAAAVAGTVGNFEIDGNMTLQDPVNNEDWAGGDLNQITTDSTGYAKESLPDIVKSDPTKSKFFRTFATEFDTRTATSPNKDTTYLGSNQKESDLVWTQQEGNPTGKSDFGRFAGYTFVQDNHPYLAFAFDRGSNTGGCATDGYYFELNQAKPVPGSTSPNPDRTPGDIRIFIYDQGCGKFAAPVFWRWNGKDWGSPIAAPSNYAIFDNQSAGIASTDLATWWPYTGPGTNINANGGLNTEAFVEAAFDLTDFSAKLGCPSTGFYQINARSTTGNGDNNQLQDYIAPLPLFVPSQCGALYIEKKDASTGAFVGGATFTIKPNPLPNTTNDPNYDASQLVVVDGGAGDADGQANGKITISGAVPGPYTVYETTPPPGYMKSTVNPQVPVTVTEYGSDQTQTNTASFNDPLGSVTWTKTEVDGTTAVPGATFLITPTGGDATASPWPKSITVVDGGLNDADHTANGSVTVDGLATGDYTIQETAAPQGYKVNSTTGYFAINASSTDYGTKAATVYTDGTYTTPFGPIEDVRNTGALTVEKLDASGNAIPCTPSMTVCATFDLYQSSDGTTYSLYKSGIVVGSDGTATVTGLPWDYYYYFKETAAPDGYNLPDHPDSLSYHITKAVADAITGGATVPVLTVSDQKSAISTSAVSDTLPDAHIYDVANLTGISTTAKGSITFTAYSDATCSTVAFASQPVLVNGPGKYESDVFVTNTAGTYYWIASYSGDGPGALSVSGTCGDTGETSVVEPLVTGLTTTATQDAQLPLGTIHDVAKIQPVTSTAGTAGGTVTFTLYGPDSGATTCSVVAKSYTVTVTSDMLKKTAGGTYYLLVQSPDFTPTEAGVYHWEAAYSGTTDGSVKASAEKCDATNALETSSVAKADTVTTTTSSQVAAKVASQQLNGGTVTVSDTATVTRVPAVDPAPTGGVTFTLYGPVRDPLTCSTTDPVSYTSAKDFPKGITLSSSGTGASSATSPDVTLVNAGTYYWVASYSGDANNNGSHDSCGETSEKIVVTPGQPTITTTATDATLSAGDSGAVIHDSATLNNLSYGASGTVTFSVYGPFDSVGQINCSAPLADTITVNPATATFAWTDVTNGSVTVSADVTVKHAGVYAWFASYGGDGKNNLPAPEPTCGNTANGNHEVSTVTPTSPSIKTTASPATVALGVAPASTTIHDSATVTGLTTGAVGTVEFRLYKDDSTCSSQLGDTLTAAIGGAQGASVDSTGTVTVLSPDVTITDPGTYRWVARFVSGDKDNLSSDPGSCTDPAEQTVVTQPVPHIQKIVRDADGQPLTGAVAVGTTLTYTVTVSNSGTTDASGPVTDVLPPGLDAPTGLISGTLYDSATRTITWPNVTVAPGKSLDLTYQATVNASAATGDGTLVNTASWFNLPAQATVYVKWIGMTVAPTCNVDTHAVMADYTVTSHNFNPLGDTTPYGVDLAWSGGAQGSAGHNFGLWDGHPVSGSVLWPGVLVANSQATSWPGWTYNSQTGVWSPNPSDPNLQPQNLTAVSFGTTVTVQVAYTSFPDCQPPGVPSIQKSSPTAVGSDKNPSGVVLPGDTIHYDIKLTNNGGTAITSDLVDTLPAGVTPVGSYTPASPDGVNGQVVTWTDVTVQPQSSITYSFDVTVNADVTPGNLVNTATWDEMSSQVTHVVQPGTPTIDKSSPTEKGSTGNPSGVVQPGATIDYKIALGNTGGSRLTSDLVDTLPAGVTPVANSYNVAPSSVNGQTITWAGVKVDPGQTVVFTFQVTVNLDVAPGNLVNSATWDGVSDTTTHVVTPGTPALTKSSPTEVGSAANPSGEVNPGSTIHYVLTLSNAAGAQVTSDLVDTLPAGVTPVAGTYTRDGVADVPDSVVGQVITWKGVTVGSGATTRFEFDVTVNLDAQAGTIVNSATWASLTDTATHKVTLLPVVAPNPTLAKTANPATGSLVTQGSVITYTVKVGNTGNGPEVGDLVDTLPAGVAPVAGSFTKDGASVEPDSIKGSTITWTNLTVQPGQTITFTYKVDVLTSAVGPTLVNTAKYLGLVSTTSHNLATIPTTGGELPKTGAPFDPITVALWAAMLLALGVMFLVFGRRNDELED